MTIELTVEATPTAIDTASLWERRAFEKQLLNVIPDLRGFARFLTGSTCEADDLVQDTVMRALRSFRQFDMNTNMKSWTFTILRNLRINLCRKRRFEELTDTSLIETPIQPNQEDSIELKQVLRALDQLPTVQREVITLVRSAGLTYEEAATVMGCKVGTIKSRVNRADAALREILGEDFRPRPVRVPHAEAARP